jgi:hypothetical protein
MGGANDIINDDGLSTGNVSDIANATPSQKLVTSIATYEMHPYKTGWVRDEVKTDYTIYFLSGIVLLIFAGIFFYLQIAAPEITGNVTELVYGYEKFVDYRLFIKTLGLLIGLPIFLPFLLNYSIDLEQAISSGIMRDSLQYIAFSTENIPLYIVQAFSYLIASAFVGLRIMIINQTCAKVFIIALLLCIPWDFIRSAGILVILYFYTALFMRPVMLWITAMSVKQVAEMPESQALLMGAHTYAIAVIAVALVCVVATFWPLLYVLIKLLTSKFARSMMWYAKRFSR